jgi:large subunit ribosomal protein L3
MSSLFSSDGRRVTLTFLELKYCQVVAHKTVGKDGYNALVLGSFLQKLSRVSKPMRGVFAKAQVKPMVILKEFRVSENNMLTVGTRVMPNHYKVGQYVDVSARSIGKGFAGVMKRHNFGGLEATHGVSISHRASGSTGQCQDPGRVFKGKKMAGHLGNKNVTIQNLQVITINESAGWIGVSGSVPGSKGCYVFVRDAVKKR